MINFSPRVCELRLAEYKNGKFKRFVELGEFAFGGEFVIVTKYGLIEKYFSKDKADPLKRFNGLFDGRTYGNGQFVLIRSAYEDSIIYAGFDDNMGVSEKIDLRLLIWGKRGGFINI